MYYVYIIKSAPFPRQMYVGCSSDLKARLAKHNEGGCPHTSKYRPWNLLFYAGFPDKYKALAFESYLRSHSGKAFASKRLV